MTFPFSEVLQTQDLKSYYEGVRLNYSIDSNIENILLVTGKILFQPNRLYKAAFKCDDGCTVYSDLSSDQIAIAQNDVVIAK